jgi:hypothetical protein
MLDYFAHRLIPEFERIENDCYVRRVGARTITVGYDPATSQLRVAANGRVKASQVLHNVGRLLDVSYDAERIHKHLRRSPVLQRRIANVPGMRPLGAWSPFELWRADDPGSAGDGRCSGHADASAGSSAAAR